MSYRRAGEATPSSGAATVTVCTNHLALCNLVEHALPGAVAEALADREALVTQVVELEDHRIGLAAVDARVLAEVADQELQSFRPDLFLAAPSLIDIPCPMSPVVLALVSSAAGSAVVVALPALLPPPGEVLVRLRL